MRPFKPPVKWIGAEIWDVCGRVHLVWYAGPQTLAPPCRRTRRVTTQLKVGESRRRIRRLSSPRRTKFRRFVDFLADRDTVTLDEIRNYINLLIAGQDRDQRVKLYQALSSHLVGKLQHQEKEMSDKEHSD